MAEKHMRDEIRMMPTTRLRSVLLVFACAVAAHAFAQAAIQAPARLLVTGNVENRLTLGLDDLQRLPVQRVEDARSVRMDGSTAAKDTEQVRRYAGVLLRDVVAAAKPVEKERRDLRRSID